MTSEDRQLLKEIIEKNILELEKEIVLLKDALHPIKKDCSLDNIAHQSLYAEQTINIQRFNEATQKLTSLIRSLSKINDKDFGICLECEEEISLERLKIIPESNYCVACMSIQNSTKR